VRRKGCYHTTGRRPSFFVNFPCTEVRARLVSDGTTFVAECFQRSSSRNHASLDLGTQEVANTSLREDRPPPCEWRCYRSFHPSNATKIAPFSMHKQLLCTECRGSYLVRRPEPLSKQAKWFAAAHEMLHLTFAREKSPTDRSNI
jgi:hypothetical protein